MAQELQLLARVVDATPDDVVTRPGEGIGVYSPGHKHLAQIELLVRNAMDFTIVTATVTVWYDCHCMYYCSCFRNCVL
jgi:hypothetical protein